MRLLPRTILGLVSTLLFACGGSTQKPQELPAPPAILTFAADKNRIAAGHSVNLSFTSRGAVSAELVDQTGKSIAFTGSASEGSALVTPSRSTFYLLRVVGAGGGDTAFVQVAVDEDLKDVFLVAAPSKIDSGQTTQLLWSAFHAREAHLQSSSGDLIQLDTTQGSGVLEVNPARTTAYTLVGTGADGPLTASAEVKVAPVLDSFETVPAAARVGEKLVFQWRTAGAGVVVLSEAKFGELHRVSHPAQTAQVDEGRFEWTVPEVFPGGQPVLEGQPLRFTLTVTQENPAVTLTRTIDSFVGAGPRIVEFLGTEAVTEGKKLQLGWRTLNAVRVQVLANGAVVFEPPSWQQAEIDQGSVSLPPPTGTTTYELIAFGNEGTRVSATKQVRVVRPPVIDAFSLPISVSQAGAPAHAQWATHDATAVTLRVKHGPVLFGSSTPAAVSNGSTDVYPGVRATIVLEAWNDAGEKVTAENTVEVTVPGSLTAPTTPVTRGDALTISWSLGANSVRVIGDPTPEAILKTASPSFIDLATAPDARTLSMADADESVSQLRLPVPFRFPFLGPVMEKFFVSTNGFVAFEPADPLYLNGDLASTSASWPLMIAPFWDDLDLGQDGRILYLIEGTAFPRRLIIQWDKVKTDPASELTFQVQLMESGEFHLVYKTLNGPGSAGDHATVGWRASPTAAKTWSRDAAALASGDELAFFSEGTATGQFASTAYKAGAFTLFTELSNGRHVVFPARVNVLARGSVLINEVMAVPDDSAPEGQWVELFNASEDPVELSGTTLRSGVTSTSFTLPDGLELPAGGYLVIGQSSDPAVNGGAPVDLVWNGFNLAGTGDDVELDATSQISTLGFLGSNVTGGSSLLNGGEGVINASGSPYVCSSRSQIFGTGGLGTPGARNEHCFPYSMERIAGDFEDISLIGTPAVGISDNQVAQVDLTSAPFNYFGTPRNYLWLTPDGNLTFTLVSPLANGTNNPVAPGDPSIGQHGMVAPFWDDLWFSGRSSAVYVAHLPATFNLPARWIIQWSHQSQRGVTPNDLTFQVKLFEDGAIEYHYDRMDFGNYSNGPAATVWLCAPDFASALAVGINQPVVESYSAYRFAPQH